MPPVTPSAISIGTLGNLAMGNRVIGASGVYPITRCSITRSPSTFSTTFVMTSCWAIGRLLVIAGVDARRGAGEQLARAGAGGDDELERVGQLRCGQSWNVLTMLSASGRMCASRARSASTMPRSRSTAAVSSSLTTTKSYSPNAATSCRATRAAAGWPPRCPCCGHAAAARGPRTTAASRRSPSVSSRAAGPCRAPCTSITSTTSSPAVEQPLGVGGRGAVQVAEHVGPLQKLAGGDHRLEPLAASQNYSPRRRPRPGAPARDV